MTTNYPYLFAAWILLGGLGMPFGEFEKLALEEGDAGVRRHALFLQFDPGI